MGDVIRLHARASAGSGGSAKSSAVTQLSVAVRKATAKSLDSQTLPRRNREIVVRSQETPADLSLAAISSSSSPSRDMKSESFMPHNVHQVHNEVKAACASAALEVGFPIVHDMHMAQSKRKLAKPAKKALWTRTFLREWREHRSLSLEDAGAEIGLSHSQLGRIERGEQPYSQKVLEAAARLYRTSVWQILYGPPDMDPGSLIGAISGSLRAS